MPGKKQGERKRSSPNFRKEAYKMNDFTLVAYIGDHNIVEKREETLRQKRDKILGSLSMHANLQERAKNRTNNSIGLQATHGGYNTISGRDRETERQRDRTTYSWLQSPDLNYQVPQCMRPGYGCDTIMKSY